MNEHVKLILVPPPGRILKNRQIFTQKCFFYIKYCNLLETDIYNPEVWMCAQLCNFVQKILILNYIPLHYKSQTAWHSLHNTQCRYVPVASGQHSVTRDISTCPHPLLAFNPLVPTRVERDFSAIWQYCSRSLPYNLFVIFFHFQCRMALCQTTIRPLNLKNPFLKVIEIIFDTIQTIKTL